MPSFLSRLFGAAAPPRAPEAKASRADALVALHALGAPRWTPRNNVALIRAGYERNAIVYRAVRMMAEAAASVPWVARERGVENDAHPALSLLRRPAPLTTGSDLLERLYTSLILFGDAYVECVALDGAPRELHALRADRMAVAPAASGWPAAYEYSVGGEKIRFDAAPGGLPPILHLRLANPLDDHYGFAPLAAAQTAIDIHNAATGWNKALLDNAARPSGALVYGGSGHLAQEQFDRLKAELEESFQGARNAGRPLLLEGGLDWKALSLTPKDMDFIAAKAVAAREIALALGVPPLLLGLPGDNTFSNYQEANRVFWRQTVIPLVARTQAAFAQWLSAAYGPFRFDYDADRLDALAQDRESEWRRIGAADFLTRDEKREAAGYASTGAA
jgi:HK97 family phage portal protein